MSSGVLSEPSGLSIVLHPDWRHVVDDETRDVTLREFEEIDLFADAMSQYDRRRTEVCYADELKQNLTANVFICEESVVELLSGHCSIDVKAIMPRVFLFNVGRGPKVARKVESSGSAGAIESMRYRAWRTERADDPGGGVFGRKDVAIEIGASWTSPGLWETERYCLMRHDFYSSLPILLAAYLATYEARVLRAS
ncbi:hypothetical protein [Streptomyces sp. NPDC058280]|uniref:hypothetical protein n=1 Tax=Streptomyces sp. NPDC058280 TaxID=3346419 RepID=UPI0036E032FA